MYSFYFLFSVLCLKFSHVIKKLQIQLPFQLELGDKLEKLEIVYHTFGVLNRKKNNVIWVCHALTANSDVTDWWSGLFGNSKLFDPKKYFIVCANIIGSCYGTTGPLSVNPKTDQPYFNAFPKFTIRDMVNAHVLLKDHLEIDTIEIGIGGSLGGYQLMEWEIMFPKTFNKLILMVTSAKESPWGIGIHTAQRMAIEADSTWRILKSNAGEKGLKAARAIGMLTYRNYSIFNKTQEDSELKTDAFRASSYLEYQGEKLVARFNAYSYWYLSKAMDTHHVGRNRKSIADALAQIDSSTLLIGISSDILCPVEEQKFLAAHIKNAIYKEIDSPYGHDGFLIEYEKLNELIYKFL